ncbi:Na+:solute symporter [Halobacteriales archaeon QS_5_70_17]|nr:MAG: Na+:solute symporter [Halobacteriales archaeon QS_5_70_17]
MLAAALQGGFQETFDRIAIPVAIIVALFVVYYGISYYFKNRVTDTGDLYLADQSIGSFVNGCAMAATWESLATFLGVIALIVSLQLPFVAMWTNFLLSIPLIVLLYGQTLRRLGSYTPATFCKERYGDRMAVVMSLLIVLVMVMYAIGQFIGLAKITNVLFGWPFELSLFVIAAIVVGYVILGGMYGVSYNSALQFWVMFTAMFVPLMFILRDLGAAGWWFPPLGYSDLTGQMQQAYPDFFDLTFGLKWYVALFLGMALGPIGLPHLAQRVFTSNSVREGRLSVFWFVVVTGLLFTTAYAVGFAGVIWTQQQGIQIPEADLDKMIFFLNFAFNGNAITGYVVAGAIAGALSTVSGHMMAISAAVAEDLVGVFKPDLSEDRKTRLGFATIAGAGLLIALVALDPPPFLVVSILWAFSITAAAITPVLVLGVWSSRINEYGALAASLVSVVLVVVVSPHVLPGITIGPGGITSAIGLDAAFVAVPLSVILLVSVSLLAERLGLAGVDRQANQRLINEMHGYPEDGRERFASAWPLVVLAVLSVPILWWGLLPW